MDPSRCPEPRSLTDAGLGYTQPAATDLFFGPYPPISPYPNIPVSPADRLIGMLRNPYAVARPVGLFSIQDAWHQPSIVCPARLSWWCNTNCSAVGTQFVVWRRAQPDRNASKSASVFAYLSATRALR